MNLKEINQAIAGCSNETIIKNTMDWIYKNEKLIDETIFIIGFTAESRSKFNWNFYDIIMFQRFLESIDVNHILFFSFGKSYHINRASLFLNVNEDPSFLFSFTTIPSALEKSNRNLPGPEKSFFSIIIFTSVY